MGLGHSIALEARVSCCPSQNCSCVQQVPLPTFGLHETWGWEAGSLFHMSTSGHMSPRGLSFTLSGLSDWCWWWAWVWYPGKATAKQLGPWGSCFPLPWGLLSPAGVGQPGTPLCYIMSHPFPSLSFERNTGLSQKQPCKWGLRLGHDKSIAGWTAAFPSQAAAVAAAAAFIAYPPPGHMFFAEPLLAPFHSSLTKICTI